MFRGPSFIVSTMQKETTPIFKHLWYDWTQQQPGIEPTNPLGQCWVPPIVAFYDQQGLLRTYSLPGSSIRTPHPPPGSPRGSQKREVKHYLYEAVHFLIAFPSNQHQSALQLFQVLPRVLDFSIFSILADHLHADRVFKGLLCEKEQGKN